MKRLLGILAFFLLIAGAALAAELPVKAPPVYKAPPLPLVASWTGFYAGGNFGYGIGQARTVIEADFFSRTSPAGMIGGGQAGYRFQRDWLVIGAEADFQWSGQRNSLCFINRILGCSPVFSTFHSSKLDWFGTVRAVAGVAQNNWLWYVTGGYAYARVEDQAGGAFQLGNGQVAAGSARATMNGWTVGAGVETRLWASNWSVRLEYLYLHLGHLTYRPPCAGQDTADGRSLVCDPPPTEVAPPVSTSVTDQVVRIGLNYALGASRPAVMHAPRPTTVPVDWAGFYIGANVGYGIGHDRLDIERIMEGGKRGGIFSVPQSPAGIIGGGQTGYRFQRGWLVVGAEADFQWSAQRDNSCTPCRGTGIYYDVNRDWFGTVRAVAGVAQNNWLWYVTGGYANGRVAINHIVPVGPIQASSHSTEDGWTAGVGVETKLWAGNWSAKFEYLYVDLGKVSFDAYCSAETASPFGLQVGRCEALTSSITDHIIRAGINYRFGSR